MFTNYRCPFCGHPLVFDKALFVCRSCRKQFGVREEVPLFGSRPGSERDPGGDASTATREGGSWDQRVEELFRGLPSDDARAEQANLLFRETQAGWKYLIDLSRAECALVLGCGTGTVPINLCRSFTRVFVLDPSLASLEFAGLASHAKGLANLHLAQGGDTACLPFPSEFFDLICLNGSEPASVLPQRDLVRELHRTLKPDGSLYFSTPNRLSYHHLFRAARGFFTPASHSPAPQEGSSFFGLRRTLQQCRFRHLDLFSLWPDRRLFYEIFFFGEGKKRTASDGPLKARIKKTLDRNKYLCPSFGVVARKKTGEKSFLQKVVAFLAGELRKDFRLDACYVTAKGNVIADIADRNAPARGLIVKIPSDDIAELQNSRNYSMLLNLHDHPVLPQEIKRLIPQPQGTHRIDGQQFYCEDRISGIPAMRIVNDERVKDEVLASAVDFLLALHRATLSTSIWSEQTYDEKIGGVIERVARAGRAGRGAFARIDGLLRSAFIGREIAIAHRHGDFSFANIVIDPKSHALSGIIDWDSSSPGLPLAIDLVNVIESIYNFKDRELGQTITEVLFKNGQSRGETEQLKRYQSAFQCADDLLRPSIVLYWLYHLDSQLKYGHLARNPRWMRDNYFTVLTELDRLL